VKCLSNRKRAVFFVFLLIFVAELAEAGELKAELPESLFFSAQIDR
jgi:hypothetical protein